VGMGENIRLLAWLALESEEHQPLGVERGQERREQGQRETISRGR